MEHGEKNSALDSIIKDISVRSESEIIKQKTKHKQMLQILFHFRIECRKYDRSTHGLTLMSVSPIIEAEEIYREEMKPHNSKGKSKRVEFDKSRDS